MTVAMQGRIRGADRRSCRAASWLECNSFKPFVALARSLPLTSRHAFATTVDTVEPAPAPGWWLLARRNPLRGS